MRLTRIQRRGREEWMIDHGVVSGRRRRQFFQSEREARSAFAQTKKDKDKAGRRWAQIPAEERVEVVRVLSEIRKAGA